MNLILTFIIILYPPAFTLNWIIEFWLNILIKTESKSHAKELTSNIIITTSTQHWISFEFVRMNLVSLSGACADSEQKSPRPEARCSSTLPYAISKWSEQKVSRSTSNEPTKKPKLNTKSESESSISKSSVREVRRKLSLLEEKRAIFQRRLFETSQDSDSGETVIAITLDDENKTSAKEEENRVEQNKKKKKARHISVKKFDTFSTFEGTFDEETGIGYLAGIEEDYTESYERQRDNYVANMGPMMADNAMEKSKVSQESMVRNQLLTLTFLSFGSPLLEHIFNRNVKIRNVKKYFEI